MSYGREPYYIYLSGTGIRFEGLGANIPNDAIDQLLYVLLKDNRRNELKERIKNGRKIYLDALKNNPHRNDKDIEFEKELESSIIQPLIKESD